MQHIKLMTDGVTRVEPADIHPNAFVQLKFFMSLPRQIYALECCRCGKIQSVLRVIDPGISKGKTTTCADWQSTCSKPAEVYYMPITLADSFVPGSFVLAPLKLSSTGQETYLWPAIVDYSPDRQSSFCKLNADKTPKAYYVTFITGSDGWYGGWFSESSVIPITGPIVQQNDSASEFQNCFKKCMNALELSLKARLRKFSAVALASVAASRSDPTIPNLTEPLENPNPDFRSELKRASEQFFVCSKACISGRIWPSAAFKLVYLELFLNEHGKENFAALELYRKHVRMSEAARQEQTSCRWLKNPFKELASKRMHSPSKSESDLSMKKIDLNTSITSKIEAPESHGNIKIRKVEDIVTAEYTKHKKNRNIHRDSTRL